MCSDLGTTTSSLSSGAFTWSAKCQQSVDECKTLSDAVMLAHHQPNAETCFTTEKTEFHRTQVQCLWPRTVGSIPLRRSFSVFLRRPGFSHQHRPQAPNVCLEKQFRTPLTPVIPTLDIPLRIYEWHPATLKGNQTMQRMPFHEM